jgi:hypothetical protein
MPRKQTTGRRYGQSWSAQRRIAKEDLVGDVRLGAIAVDCPDPAELGDFYENVLEMEVMVSSADLVAL